MSAVRRHLRAWTTLAVVIQAIALAAWLPWPCCKQHAHRADGQAPPCHQAASAGHCGMNAAAQPCPMHGSEDAIVEQAADAGADCAMRGGCDAHASLLALLLSNHGILPASAVLSVDLPAHAPPPAARQQLIAQLTPPDSPPPRA